MNFLFSGDFRFFWPESIKDFVSFPSAWDSSLNTGLGQSQLSALWIISYFNFTALFTKLGLSWDLIQLIFWILPAFFISLLSSFFLFKHLFKEVKFSVISGVIYSLNTYFLMILTGGQLGVSLSYSLVPLVFLSFIKLLKKSNLKNSFLTGLILSLQIIFDPRIVYLTLILVILYFLFNFSKFKRSKNKFIFPLPFIMSVLLNSFWILPLILTRSSTIPAGFDSVSSFKFFSFADFSHTLSLLHPNFPENIFGKIYFLDPKFLILPFIAFSSLLFKRDKNIIYFSIISLLGIFLAKGANPPFGEINTWVFENLPGMSMFRDPTKWYILVALSYSILIPYALLNFSVWVKSKVKFIHFSKLLSLIFVIYLLFLISPIVKQIKVQKVPQDYVLLANFLNNQKSFFRTLWIPKWQRFGYFSNNHPTIGREELYQGDAKMQVSKLNEQALRDLSIKYVIVPYDSESEIFLKDRKYNENEYKDTINRLRRIFWLKEVGGFDTLKVFELSNPKDHFWSPSDSLKVQYRFVSPTGYRVEVENAKKGDLLVFSEGFDKNWNVQNSEFRTQSSEFERVNSFVLPRDGSYDLKVGYEPQTFVNIGLFVSGLIALSILLILNFDRFIIRLLPSF